MRTIETGNGWEEVPVCYACGGAGYFDGGPMRDDEECSHCGGTGIEPE